MGNHLRTSYFRLVGVSLFAAGLAFAAGACNTTPVSPLQNDGSNNPDDTPPTDQTGAGNSVNASQLEQLSLERINRARLRPGQEASNNGITVDEGIPGQINSTPKPPVALNTKLNDSAHGHSQDMLNRDYFAHNTPEGKTPWARMETAGYDFVTAGENLAWRGTTGSLDEASFVEMQHVNLFVDSDIPNRGHRVTMLNADFREVGISIIRGSFMQDGISYDSIMQTQDYGTTAAGSTFVLGVVYTDANHNNQYDFGEGTANSSVLLDTTAKNTNAAGGYSFEVLDPGTYTLRFFNGKTQSVVVGGGIPNIKVDLAGSNVVVNLGLGPL